MSHLFTLINTTQEPVSKEKLTHVAETMRFWLPDQIETANHKNIGMGLLSLHTGSFTSELYRKDKLFLVCDARLDNKEELCTRLRLRKKTQSPATILAEAYKKWGLDCAKYLLGDFAFSLYNEEEQSLLLVRDQIGIKPLYYYHGPRHFIAGSGIKSIKAFQLAEHPLSHSYIGSMLTGQVAGKEQSCYENIKQLPPGHTLLLKNKQIHLSQYWDMNPKRTLCFKDENEYIEGLREKISCSVQRRIKDIQHPGCELSGGIDSSAVFSFAHEKNPGITAFSHVMDEEEKRNLFPKKDERAFIESLMQHRQSRQIHYVTSKNEDLPATLKKYCYLFDGVTHSAFHLLSNPLYKGVSDHKINVLLSGFGGDELVSSKAHGYLNELAVNKQWKTLYAELQARKSGSQASIAWMKKALKSYLPIDEITTEIEKMRDKQFNHFPLNPAFCHAQNLRRQYKNKTNLPKSPILSQKQYEQINHPHVANRLAHCATAAESRRIEYRYPLLDIELMEYYLALPAAIKQKNGIIRYPIRKAIAGYVPEMIQWRTDKSFHTIPNFFALYYNHFDAISELIANAAHTDASHYIDLPRLEQWSRELLDQNGRIAYRFQGIFSYLWFLQYLSHEKS